MPWWLKDYGDTEGPLGFPMHDAEAKSLDKLLSDNPDAEYEQLVVEKATPPAALSPGERADVSWIMTEQRDRARDVVLLSGFRDELYRNNPIVTLNHNYTIEPVGKSVWRRKVREGDVRGVKAKTVYPERPAEWTGDRPLARRRRLRPGQERPDDRKVHRLFGGDFVGLPLQWGVLGVNYTLEPL